MTRILSEASPIGFWVATFSLYTEQALGVSSYKDSNTIKSRFHPYDLIDLLPDSPYFQIWSHGD